MDTPRDMSQFQRMFKQSSGIDLSQYKDDFFEKCLTSRMAEIKETDPGAYISKALADKRELNVFLEAFTVYHSRFMRDSQKYRVLREIVFPAAMKKALAAGRQLRVWSAGCAAGEEPYSIAMSACETFGDKEAQRQISIIATDINRALLEKAASGSYVGIEFCGNEVDAYYLGKYFKIDGQTVTVRDDIRRMVDFRQHNLITDETFPGMDVIFCRNVMIYLKQSAKKSILNAFYKSLTPDGFLFLGNAEMVEDSLYCYFRKIKMYGEFVYVKIARDSDEFRDRERRQEIIRAGLGLP